MVWQVTFASSQNEPAYIVREKLLKKKQNKGDEHKSESAQEGYTIKWCVC